MTGPNDSQHYANKGKWETKIPTSQEWGPEGPGPYSTCVGRGGKYDSNVAPFRTTRLAAFTNLLSNVVRPKRFLSHLILTLSWFLKNKIRSRLEKFTPSYNPFFGVVQIIILAKARITRNTTHFSPQYRGKNIVYYVTNVEPHELLEFDVGRPLPDVIPKRVNLLAIVLGVLSCFF